MYYCRVCFRRFGQERRGLGMYNPVHNFTCRDCQLLKVAAKPPPEKRVESLRGKTQSGSIVEQLEILARLYQDGALTEQEFKTLKSRLIDGE